MKRPVVLICGASERDERSLASFLSARLAVGENVSADYLIVGDEESANLIIHASEAPQKDVLIIQARDGLEIAAVDGKAPQRFMWMPGGRHTIHASKGDEPIEITVEVDRQTAQVAQRALEVLRAKNGTRPFLDFEHREKEASAWPNKFEWSDLPKPGVYVTAEWSRAGEESVVGKEFRGFSPAFTVDKLVTSEKQPARVNGLPLVMGGLTNVPAFKDNLPLWASYPDGAKGAAVVVTGWDDENLEIKNMKQTLEVLRAKQAELHGEVNTLKARVATAADADKAVQAAELKAKQAELETVEAKIWAREATERAEKAENTIKAANVKRAEVAITAAITRGAIGAQDTTVQARWKSICETDPENIALVEALPGNPALGGERITASGARVQVGNEDINRVVKAYGEEKNPLLRGQLWARDMRPRFNNEWDGIIRAANSLGTLAGVLVTQRSLDLLKYEFPELSRITTDFSAEPADFNQTVRTRLRTVPAVGDYDPTTGYPDEDVTDTDVDVTINKHKSVQVVYSANDLASTKRLLFPEQEEGMHYALGNQVVADTFALITPGNFPNAVTAALAEMSRSTVIAMKVALNKKKVTGGTRTALFDSDYYGELEKDQTIVANLINPQSGQAIGTSQLPPIAKFQPYEANYLAAGKLHGFGMRADALALSARLPNDYSTVFPGVTGGGVVQVVTNPDTKLSVMLVMFIDHKLGQARMRVAMMYGMAVGNSDCGVRLVEP